MMCQRKFNNCEKCTTLARDVHNGGGDACMGKGDIWEISVLLLNFSVNLKLL